jgi:hypothetical protein
VTNIEDPKLPFVTRRAFFIARGGPC